MDTLNIFDLLLSSGFLVTLLGWLRERKLNKAKGERDQLLVYKEMSDAKDETLAEQNERIINLENEVIKVLEKMGLFERAFLRGNACRYYHLCPIRSELQKSKANLFVCPERQPPMEEKGIRYPRDHPDGSGTHGYPDGQPP